MNINLIKTISSTIRLVVEITRIKSRQKQAQERESKSRKMSVDWKQRFFQKQKWKEQRKKNFFFVVSKSIRCFDKYKQQFIKNAKNNRRNVEKKMSSKQKSKFDSRVELDCENFSKENENCNNREKNFKTKKILQVIISRNRKNLETISI